MAPSGTLRLRGRSWPPGSYAIMAVLNRTPDSFYDHGATYRFAAAVSSADRAVAAGADIIDIGGVKAGPGAEVSPAQEIDRVAAVVAAVRDRHPEVVISVDWLVLSIRRRAARIRASSSSMPNGLVT